MTRVVTELDEALKKSTFAYHSAVIRSVIVDMENNNFSSITVQSFIQGYHVYKDETSWVPRIGEQRGLKREPLNEKDGNAVAVVRPLPRNFTEANHPNTVSKEDEIVGHIPLQMSQYVSKFLKRRTNKGKAIITGKHGNRGAGYGLEIPCSYIFYGDNDISIPWLREKIESAGIFHIE